LSARWTNALLNLLKPCVLAHVIQFFFCCQMNACITEFAKPRMLAHVFSSFCCQMSACTTEFVKAMRACTSYSGSSFSARWANACQSHACLHMYSAFSFLSDERMHPRSCQRATSAACFDTGDTLVVCQMNECITGAVKSHACMQPADMNSAVVAPQRGENTLILTDVIQFLKLVWKGRCNDGQTSNLHFWFLSWREFDACMDCLSTPVWHCSELTLFGCCRSVSGAAWLHVRCSTLAWLFLSVPLLLFAVVPAAVCPLSFCCSLSIVSLHR